MNSLLNIFFGVPQSRYAGLALLCSIIIVSIILFFSPGESNKFTMFIILLLISLPSIALSLFQLTCIVTGSNNKHWWCNTYAWVFTGLIVFYAIYFIIYALLYYNKSESFAENTESNATSNIFVAANIKNNTSNINNNTPIQLSGNIDTNTSNYTTSNITNMYEGAKYIPNFVKNDSLTFADVLNSR